MHRNKIITIVLLGAAASAVSGCVAVPAGPAPVPSRQTGSHTPDVEPQIVQQPAKEALETVPPAASAGRKRPHREVPSARRPGAPPVDRVAGPHWTGTRPATGTVRRDRAPQPPPGHPAPVATAKVDVCALGEGYGHWKPDSPQARICRQTYRSR